MNVSYLVPRITSYLFHKSLYRTIRWQSTRTILGDRMSIDYEKTLNGRLLIYLNENHNQQKVPALGSKTIDSYVHGNQHILQNFNIDDITNLFYSAQKNKLGNDKKNLAKLLKALDVECSLRLQNLDLKSQLQILNAYMSVVPNRIREYQFYKCFMNSIDEHIKNSTKAELIQLIFYIGLEKGNKKVLNDLKKCLSRINREFLDNLTIEDMCIICNSTQRTNTQIKDKNVLSKVKQTLHENLFLLKDTALLITLIKTIRNNHYQDEDLLNTISCTIFFNNTIQYYNFAAMSYILALFADYFYYEEKLIDLFVAKSVKELERTKNSNSKTTHVSELMRAKDIANFLWALAILDYERADVNMLKNLVIPKIEERIALGEYKTQPHHLIDSILCLWMLNCSSKALLCSALSEENLSKVRGNSKHTNRLNLLLTCIKLEDSVLFNNIGVIPAAGNSNFNRSSWQTHNRPVFNKIFTTLNCISSKLEIDKFEVNSEIPYLNIVGITGYKNETKAVHVEVLDEFTSLKNKDCCPTGFMNLKLRILENLKVPLVTITQTDIEDTSDQELKEFLIDDVQMALKFF